MDRVSVFIPMKTDLPFVGVVYFGCVHIFPFGVCGWLVLSASQWKAYNFSKKRENHAQPPNIFSKRMERTFFRDAASATAPKATEVDEFTSSSSHLWAVLQSCCGVVDQGETLPAVRRVVHQAALWTLCVQSRSALDGRGALVARSHS
jgi:hypothetical protein